MNEVAVWEDKNMRRLIFSFYISPTRVFMSRHPPLPYLGDPFFFAYRSVPWMKVSSAWFWLSYVDCLAHSDIRAHQARHRIPHHNAHSQTQEGRPP
jgi:hypothetical protein